MKELCTQLHDQCPACSHKFHHLVPFDEVSRETLKEFKVFQVIKTRLYGILKPRSMKQLAAYWGACIYISKLISDENKQYDSKGKQVDFIVKTTVAKQAPQLIKYFFMKDGIMYIQPISISFENMKHLEACDYFNIALPILADLGNMTLEKLKHEIGIKDND